MKAIWKISMYALLVFAFAASSCKEDDDLPQADRLFRPVGLNITASSGITYCNLIVRWNAMPGVKSYTIEISSDSLLFAEQNIFERFVTHDVEHVTASLRRGDRVSVRVRCNSDDMEHDSRFLEQTLIVPLENIFFSSQSGDVRATSITMRFPVGDLITHLKLINLATQDTTVYQLSQSDIDTGVYRIRNVNGDTDYRVEIFYGDAIRGQRYVKTAYAPSGPNVIFLPEGVDLAAELADPANVGKILLLPEDFKCALTSTVTIAGGMTIYGNPDGARAEIEAKVGSIFRFSYTEPSDAIEFVYCNFVNNRTDADYMFNMNASFADVSKLAFTNCRMAGFRRNFFRVQGSITGIVDTILIDNCEVERMGQNGDYAFFHIAVAGVAVRNIIVKNSTLNIIGCHFIYFAETRTVGCQSVLIENCTLYDMMTSTSNRWFINLGNSNNPENSSVTLRNVILGSTYAGREPLGVKRDNVVMTVVNTYQTTDWTLETATAVDDATPYAGSAADLFVDPANGNFSFKDEDFVAKETAGDPRWR